MKHHDTPTKQALRGRSRAPRLGRALQPFILSAFALLAVAGCKQEAAGVSPLSPEQLLSEPPAHALILDVRTPEEYANGHVPGARNIPYDQLPDRLGELGDDRDRNVVVYCESGRRAGMAESALLAAGFTSLHHLEGDMKAWREAGRPTQAEGAP
jgi:rhodanese-related sulfurtransferase